MSKSALHITLSRLGALLVFLILLTIANILYINNSVYLGVVSFLNTKIIVVILFSLLLYLGELFFVFGFPLNFPAPIFNAFGGIILVDFIFDMMVLGLGFAGLDLSFVMRILEIVVVVLVFLLAIIVGYVRVFGSIGRRQREKKKKEEGWDWDDVKKEIKDTVHDVVGNIKNAVNPEEEKPKTKKKVSKKKTSSKKKVKKK